MQPPPPPIEPVQLPPASLASGAEILTRLRRYSAFSDPSGDIDLDRTVASLSRGEFLRVFPRRPRKRWGQLIQVDRGPQPAAGPVLAGSRHGGHSSAGASIPKAGSRWRFSRMAPRTRESSCRPSGRAATRCPILAPSCWCWVISAAWRVSGNSGIG